MMTTPSTSTLRGLAPDEAAATWLVRIDAGPLGPEEQAEFDAWRAESAANAAAFCWPAVAKPSLLRKV